MPLGSGQISFGNVLNEIGWVTNPSSGISNTYMVAAGATGLTYTYYQTDSLYGWFEIDQVQDRQILSDDLSGNYSFYTEIRVCEASYHANLPGVYPGATIADVSMTWAIDTTFWDGLGFAYYNDGCVISIGNNNTTDNYSRLCWVPGTCYVDTWVCNSVTPTGSGNQINSPLQTTFYLGFFKSKTRGRKIQCFCS